MAPCGARCRALRPTHSAGRPTEGPRPTPRLIQPRSVTSPARRQRSCELHTFDVGRRCTPLPHAASTQSMVRSPPARLFGPDRRARILRCAAPDQLALYLHRMPACVRCCFLHASSHLLALHPSQQPSDDAVVLLVHHPDARPRSPTLLAWRRRRCCGWRRLRRRRWRRGGQLGLLGLGEVHRVASRRAAEDANAKGRKFPLRTARDGRLRDRDQRPGS